MTRSVLSARPGTAALDELMGGRYRIVRPLAGGGMGEVFEVEHVALGRRFALKVVRPELLTNDTVVSRFENEARAMGVVDSIHIVPIIDVGRTEAGVPFLVMQLLHGEDLGRIITRTLPSPGLAAEIVRQAAIGAAAAHQHGIVHRDLKPSNIFVGDGIDDGPLVRLLDFGIAKLDPTLRGAEGRTVTGAMMGTAHYMSPEQARGVAVDRRADVYALGVVLYEALTGRRPFHGDGYNAVIYSILTHSPERVDVLRPELPTGLADVVERAMARDLERRFQTAESLVSALAPFARVITAGAPVPPGWAGGELPPTRDALPSLAVERRGVRRRAPVILGVALGLAAGTVTGATLLAPRLAARTTTTRQTAPVPATSAVFAVPAASTPRAPFAREPERGPAPEPAHTSTAPARPVSRTGDARAGGSTSHGSRLRSGKARVVVGNDKPAGRPAPTSDPFVRENPYEK